LKLFLVICLTHFRKAFDTVDADLLILKLFHYGFSNWALDLVKNYFNNRYQITKFGNSCSDKLTIELGVPQGLILGLFFFIIFINDLAFRLIHIVIKLSADDITLIIAEHNLDTCISKFKSAVFSMIEWCDYNRLDTNWSKTCAMFVHNKTDLKINYDKITINSKIQVAIVDKFKLLGVTIDNRLKFTTNIAETAIKVNKKIHCIKRLFYLSTNVKLQFFKKFLRLYFDFCLTFTIYYSKTALQKLSNLCYNYLYKLFKFQLNNMEFKWIIDFLKIYKMFSFQHRIFYGLSIFSSNCKNNKTIDIIETNLVWNTGHNLRNKNHLTRYHVNLKEG
jgi:hypothetical protein